MAHRTLEAARLPSAKIVARVQSFARLRGKG
jgi:hypothetical protein